MSLTLEEYRAQIEPQLPPEPTLDPELVDRATRAFRHTHACIADGGSDGEYEGLTVDAVLAGAGVQFNEDRRLYLAYVRAVREAVTDEGPGKPRGRNNPLTDEERERIRTLARREGLTYRDVAERVGRCLSTVTRVVRGVA